MKGLNDYLEKKRLFFPRFFFLSNDELLEILSETKDPLRVQPHVKKCFEGIDKLRFVQDKFGNQDVDAMISSHEEEVPFLSLIYPTEAKGMVEKWLLQVEKQMMAALRDVIARAKADRPHRGPAFAEWAIKWPGQAVLTADSVSFTAATEAAIVANDLQRAVDECGANLGEVTHLVRSGSKMEARKRKTTRALITQMIRDRDVLTRLNEEKVASPADFDWMANMRYYMSGGHEEKIEIRVDIIDTTLR